MKKTLSKGFMLLWMLVVGLNAYANMFATWNDIKIDFTNGNLLTEAEINNQTSLNFGITVDENGAVSRVAADAAEAKAIINGKFHSNEHGLQNFSASVPVEGAVKITFGTCAWGGDVTVKNANGETVTTFNTNTGACYHNNKEANVISAFYKMNEATTLTISGGAYVPYFAVETVNIDDIPSDIQISYSLGNTTAVGSVPEKEKVEIGAEYTIPLNRTLFAEGKTLTGWTDGTNTYKPGETIKAPESDVEFTPIFTDNQNNLSDRTEPVELLFDFQRRNGAPLLSKQGGGAVGVYVTQAVVNGETIDVKLDYDATNGKIANGNWTDWCQMNGGTIFTVPSCKGAQVTIEAYSNITTTTIDGQSDYAQAQTITYTIANTADAIDIVIGDGSYYRYIKVNLPVVQQAGGKTYNNEAATVIWNFNSTTFGVADTITPADGFSMTATNTGDLEITGTAKRTADNAADGITFVKLRPSGSTQSVEWSLKPAAGLTFTPTKVSGWIQRFGTDAQNGVTITATLANGTSMELGNYTAPRANHDTATDKYAGNSNYTNQFVIELTEEQQEALTSGDSFSIFATVGVGSAKEGGFSDIHIEGLLNGTIADVNKYTLAIAPSSEDAGTVSAYPSAEEYEEGTEVTLTATKKFGYNFVNWTDENGNEISTDAKFVYTVENDIKLTANFVAVNTYELNLTVDGSNDYMVEVSPAPTVVDGKYMYEEGIYVMLAANSYEGLVTFTNWNDGTTNSEMSVKMDENKTIVANYSEADIIAGWDFYTAGGSGRPADFYAEENDACAFTLVNENDGSNSGWLDKSWIAAGGYESFKGAAVNWRTGSSNGDVGHWYWQTKVNAEAFTDIQLQFQMLYNYNAYTTYNVEYSTNGQDWKQFGSITMEGAKNPASFKGALGSDANNQKDLYIRWTPDKSSAIDGSASANDGNAIAMVFITGTPKLVNDGKAPVLVTTVPVEGANNASASGKVVLTFDKKVKMAEGAVGYINDSRIDSNTQSPTIGTVSGKTITFEYKGLDYANEYVFYLPANSVSDLTDNVLEEAINIHFTTMNRPTIDKGLYDVVVSNTDELVAAINAANSRADKSKRYRIFVKNGIYSLPLSTSATISCDDGNTYPSPITFITASNISFIGESIDGAVITNAIPENATYGGTYGSTSVYDGIGKSDVLQIQGGANNLYFQDITIKSGIGDALGRNIAVQDKGTKNIYKNVCLFAYQDTWTSNNDNGLYYFEGGKLRGRTDYLCGKGDIYFNAVDLIMCEKGGYLAVPSKPAKIGWVFKDCTIKGERNDINGNYTLGRPWGSGTPVALYIDTKMEVIPSSIGWNEMGTGWPKRFAEYNSTTSTGSVIDLSGRKTTFGEGHANNPVLTAAEAAEASDMTNMYGDWNPTQYTEQAPLPSNVTLNGNTLTWDNSNYALLWAIVKNGSVVDFTNEPTYTVDDTDATYAVRAANEMGGLGEAVEASFLTGISVNAENADVTTIEYFTADGIKTNKANKGINIVVKTLGNGQKVVSKEIVR